jgi:hypothetical protein
MQSAQTLSRNTLAAMRLVNSNMSKTAGLLTSGTFFLIAIALIGWQAVCISSCKPMELMETLQSYLYRPGPNYYYSHFSGLQCACLLAFDALQTLRLFEHTCGQGAPSLRTRVLRALTPMYWTVLNASALACTICYSLTPKPEVTAIQALIFINSLVTLIKLFVDHKSRHERQTLKRVASGAKRYPRLSSFLHALANSVDRLLKSFRFVLSILFLVGAIQLAMRYRFQNP